MIRFGLVRVLVSILLFTARPEMVRAAPRMPDGRYRLVGHLKPCQKTSADLCFIIHQGTISQRTLMIVVTPWQARLQAMLDLKSAIVMEGRIAKNTFTPESKPRLSLPSADDVLNDGERAVNLK